jgi:hypothetical protein
MLMADPVETEDFGPNLSPNSKHVNPGPYSGSFDSVILNEVLTAIAGRTK